MVKKLLKQELIYYIRSLLPVYVVLMGIALMGRIIHIFEKNHWIYSLVSNVSLGIYAVSIIVTMVFATIFIVIRYYKNMFTGEGYLTLTLPVSFVQHLSAKLIAAMLVNVTTLVTVLLSVVIFLGGEWMVEIHKAVVYLTADVVEMAGTHLGFYIVEFVVLAIVGMAAGILNYYMCISLGQTFSKRRILAAIGIYYGIYLAIQVIVTAMSVVITLAVENMNLAACEEWISLHYKGLIHGGLIGGIVCSLIISAILFFICHTILKKKLNLE